MKTKILVLNPSFAGAICAGMVLLAASGVSAQNVFVANWFAPGDIYEIAPGGGALNTFAAGGLGELEDLAFNSTGDLFVTVTFGVVEITPGGVATTFAALSGGGNSLAFNSAGDLLVADGNQVTEITPGGSQSVFSTGIGNATGLAIQGQTLPVPEPSTLALAGLGAGALLAYRRRKN